MSRIRIDEAAWFTSSYSAGENSDCVEVARLADAVAVRDSKTRTAGHLTTSHASWHTFVASVKASSRQ